MKKINPIQADCPKTDNGQRILLSVCLGFSAMIEIPLTQGKFALIDDNMFDRINYFQWYANKQGNTLYANTNLSVNGGRTNITMHRLIMGIPNCKIDHKDGNGLNNTIGNLRLATKSENGRNRQKQMGTSSVYKGVSWHKNRGKWSAYITVDDERMYLGLCNDEITAARRYDMAALFFFGEFARLNIVCTHVKI